MSYELQAKTVVKVLGALRLAKEECSSLDDFFDIEDLEWQIRRDVRRSVWANAPRGRAHKRWQERQSFEASINKAFEKGTQDTITQRHREEKHT